VCAYGALAKNPTKAARARPALPRHTWQTLATSGHVQRYRFHRIVRPRW
jgi:hypothetical protein